MRGRWRAGPAAWPVRLLPERCWLAPPRMMDLEALRGGPVTSAPIQNGLIDSWGRQDLIGGINFCHDAIGGLQRIRNTPLPAPYDVFVRLITWVYGLQLLLQFQQSGNTLIGAILFLGFLTAERIGAYVEGPFDRDGSSFSLPLNAICIMITTDLMERPLDFGSFRPSQDPVRWE